MGAKNIVVVATTTVPWWSWLLLTYHCQLSRSCCPQRQREPVRPGVTRTLDPKHGMVYHMSGFTDTPENLCLTKLRVFLPSLMLGLG